MKRGRLGELVEPKDALSRAGAAGVAASGGQVGEEAGKTMHGPALRGGFVAFLVPDASRGLGFRDGVAGPAAAVQFFIFEERRGQGFAHVPLDIVGEHCDEDVGAHVVRRAVVDGSNAQVDALETAEGLLDLSEALVGAHRVLGGKFLASLAGADDVDAVEAGFVFDLFEVAFELETAVPDMEDKMFAHFVGVDHLADFDADRVG